MLKDEIESRDEYQMLVAYSLEPIANKQVICSEHLGISYNII